MSAATAAPLSIRGLVNAVLTCPGRDLSFFVRVYRPGEQDPFAVLPVDAWELVPPARAKTVEADGENAPAKSGLVTLSIILPSEILDDPATGTVRPDEAVPRPLDPGAGGPAPKRAGRPEPAPPNAADGQS